MEHHVNWFTVLLNKYLGSYVLAFLEGIGVHPHDPAHPIPNQVAMTFVVVVLLMLFVLWLKPRLSVDRPGAVQQCVEFLFTNPLGVGIRDLLDSNVGHHGRQYMAMVGTISIFILASNAISLVPLFDSPTAHPTVPLACALITWVYYHWAGVRHVGAKHYSVHFTGPILPLAPLMLLVEPVSHLARILSLTVRLYANMFSSELLYFSILGLLLAPTQALLEKNVAFGLGVGVVAAVLPVAFVILHAFVAVMQAFVFTILPTIYLGLATAEEH